MSSPQLAPLFQAIGDSREVLILPHNNPDSDAIASAVALKYLLNESLKVEARILYKGIIGRAENKALARYLNHPLHHLNADDLSQDIPIILIDTQPGRSNNPASTKEKIAVVIDHHDWYDPSRQDEVTFAEVRPELGATSTILTGYLRAAQLDLSTELATALFYGIKTSTMGLGRNTSPADAEAYYYLQPQIDVEAVATIETARVPSNYFKSFDATLRAARIYDGVVIAYIGAMLYPDLTAEMADLLLRLEESRWVICMGTYEKSFIISVRTRHQNGRAGRFVQAIIGPDGTAGGHGTMAGGQLQLTDHATESLVPQITTRILQYLDLPDDMPGRPLIVDK